VEGSEREGLAGEILHGERGYGVRHGMGKEMMI
jgi:hypothetical protein